MTHFVTNIIHSFSSCPPPTPPVPNIQAHKPSQGDPQPHSPTKVVTTEEVQACSQEDAWVLHCPNPLDHQPANNTPSQYLQMACSVCHPASIPPVFTWCCLIQLLKISAVLTRTVNSEANMRGSIQQALLMDASTKSTSAMLEVGTSPFQRGKPISLLKRRSRRLNRK